MKTKYNSPGKPTPKTHKSTTQITAYPDLKMKFTSAIAAVFLALPLVSAVDCAAPLLSLCCIHVDGPYPRGYAGSKILL